MSNEQHPFREASENHGGSVSLGMIWAGAFAIGPYLAAKTLLLCGARPNEWSLTPHVGIIVSFIRRTAPAETIAAIFYSYAAASILIIFPLTKHFLRHGIARSLKANALLAVMFAYGIVLAYTLVTGPSEDSFVGAPTRATLGLQAAAANQFTYAALCASLIAQIVIVFSATAVAIYLALAERR